jgi:hypothetical protein
MKKTAKRNRKEPSLAPGDKGVLEKSANQKEKAVGDFTRVTTLSYDEVDPS